MSLEGTTGDPRERSREEFDHVTNTVIEESKQSILEEYRADDFDSLLLISSASRGGSSLLFDVLRHHEDTCSPDGEHGKWYTLNGICYPTFDSDRVPRDFESFDRNRLLTDLLTDIGATTEGGDRTHRVDTMLLRLPLQFPDADVPWQQIREDMLDGAAFEEVLQDLDISPIHFDEYADGDASTPLEQEAVEERPLITPHDHKRGLESDDFDRTLVLKTSVDAYRLPWIRDQLFPEMDVDLVHLTRNPAASINGLYDGWRLNRGFQTYDVGDLDLEGYEGSLWNYDLPPTWYRDGRLIDVCLEQWTQAHRHILEGRDAFDDVLRVRFEDLLQNTESTVKEIVEFADLGESALLEQNVDDLNQVMTTKDPELARWRNREDLVRGALQRADKPFETVRQELGYTEESEWI